MSRARYYPYIHKPADPMRLKHFEKFADRASGVANGKYGQAHRVAAGFRFALTYDTPSLYAGCLGVAGALGYTMSGVEAAAASGAPDAHTPLKRARCHMQRIRFFRPLAMVMGCLGIVLSSAQAAPRSSLDLNSEWQFRQRMPATSTPAEWRPATVPGDVHLDLLANKLIPDPFYRDNEAK